jgi:hypothetical protein
MERAYMKARVENQEEEFNITEIPVLLKTDGTHFFLKWFKENRRFRVSISFKYLFKKCGLRVNVIRNTDKIPSNKLEFLYKLLTDNQAIFRKIDYASTEKYIGFRHLVDTENRTEIFLFERVFDGKKNNIIVFLSENYWTIDEYLDTKIGED